MVVSLNLPTGQQIKFVFLQTKLIKSQLIAILTLTLGKRPIIKFMEELSGNSSLGGILQRKPIGLGSKNGFMVIIVTLLMITLHWI